MTSNVSNIISFDSRPNSHPIHPKLLIEQVYSAGSIAVAARDVTTKTAGLMLQALGLLVIDEVCADGSLRRVRSSESHKSTDRPWRFSKPPFSGEVGVPDAGGAYVQAGSAPV
jgi:hypothetical protein